MRTLIVNQKIVVAIVAVMLLIYGIQGTGNVHAQDNAPEFTPVSDRTPQVRDTIVALVPGVDSANDVTAEHLSLITNLNLSDQNITALKAGDFDGLSSLNSLALYKNTLSSLPADIFSGLSALSRLDLGSNKLNGLPADIFSELSSLNWLSLSFNQLNSLPADTFSGPSSLRTLNLSYNKLTGLSADIFSGFSSLNTLNLTSNKLSNLPADIFSGLSSLNWLGLSFNQLSSLPAGIFSGLSSLRSFYLGDNAVNLSITVSLEQIEENQFKATAPTGAPFNIILPFSITNATVDGGANTVMIPAGSVESESLAVTRIPGTSDAITVDIVVLPELPTGHYGYSLVEPSGLDADNSLIFAVGIPVPTYDPNVNHAPVFTEGISTTRSVAENTPAGVNIGSPVVATDEDDDPLTYGLEGPDAAAFGIVGTTGQLQTRAPLDYETRNAYAVTVIVSDGRGGADTIGVTINVTDENEDPIFVEGDSTTRSVAENTDAGVNIGGAVSATDEDGDPLTYSLGGIDAASFGIVGTTGQLQTRAELDYETKNAYAVTVMVSDGNGGTDTIGVAISVTDMDEGTVPVIEGTVIPEVDETPKTHAPVFAGSRTTRSIAENTPAGVNIGSPVSATDADDDTLTYTLSGTDAGSFGIVRSSGQLQTQAPLDYETKNAYTVTVTVSDGSRTDIITVAITIIDVDETPKTHDPVFAGSRTTRSIAENTPAGVNIGSPVSATDADDDTLTYTLGGTDASSFSIVRGSGQLQTKVPLDYETKNAYSVTVTVSDGGRTDVISVIIIIIDVDETTRPDKVGGEISISEIMFGSERRFTPPQWIELHNSGADLINLTGWKLVIQNQNSTDLTGATTRDEPLVNATITFEDDFWGDAPRIWPDDVILVVSNDDSENSKNLTEGQIYDLQWRTDLPLGLWSIILSTEGFSIKLIDDEGNLVDEAGNLEGGVLQWKLPYGANRGRTREGHRTSMIRRYADSVALDGTQAGGWISAVDAKLTAEQRTYYGDENDISSPGIGIVVNEIASQFTDYDANRDGVVNVLDLVFIAGRFGQSGPNSADVNGDGVVSILDLIKVAGALNEAAAAPSLHPTVLPMLSASDIRGWLIQAQSLDFVDAELQRGILLLEQLLTALIPKETELLLNYPNPFNPETWIPYRLAEDAFVTLTIYDQRGRVIRRFNVGYQTAAVYESRSQAIYWDGRNEVGDRVASGIYFYTLTAGDYSATRKMLILK